MFRARHFIPLVLPLALVTAKLFAQPAATESTGAPATAPEGQQESPARPESPSPGKREDSPFDYQASEEISEDLPVSFPVDI